MKEIRITQVVGGFIVAIGDNGVQTLQVTPNLGQATKLARTLFDEVEPVTMVEKAAKVG